MLLAVLVPARAGMADVSRRRACTVVHEASSLHCILAQRIKGWLRLGGFSSPISRL